MSLFGDVLRGSGYSTGNPLLYEAGQSIDRTNSPTNPSLPPRAQNYLGSSTRKRSPEQIKSVNDQIVGLYGNNQAQDYLPTINNAYTNLGQPADDWDRSDTTGKFVTSLASTFVDRVYEKTGSLPTEDQIHSYVAQNANGANASKFIQNGFNTDQMYNAADDYLNSNPDALTNPGTKSAAEQRILSLNDQLDKAYNSGAQNYVSSYDQNVYGPNKQRTANDLAGQGMLGQPNSRYSLDQVDANRGRDISSGLNTLAGERAKGSVDLGKTIENLLQSQQGINNQASQFNKTFNAGRDDTYFNQGLQNRGLTIAQHLGQLQAAGQKNDGVAGALGGGLSGAGSGAMVGGPWGALIGGVGGSALGYFGSKK